VAPNHTYYLLSDGLLDQAGGRDGHSFGNQRFRDWILQHAHLPLAEQRKRLIETLDGYRGDYPQRDDITVLAFRLT
jgi:serine phosphatase RsbU (regulator of sigma subunit)